MSIPNSLFAQAFRYQNLSRFFSVLVGMMVFIATLSVTAGLALSLATWSWHIGAHNQLTVEIPATADEATVSQSDRVQQSMAILQAMPELEKIRLLGDNEVQKLLTPWMKQPELLKDLALPNLIDMERKAGSTLTASDITEKLKNIAGDVRVDDHDVWLADLQNVVYGLLILAAFIVCTAGMTLMIAVGLMCRAIMATERETLSLLHVLGADDLMIARNFQHHARQLAASSTWYGFAAALICGAVLAFFLRHISQPELLPIFMWIGALALVLCVPLATMTIAASAAKLSALKVLRAMP
jgi:cell division transport system permease protein